MKNQYINKFALFIILMSLCNGCVGAALIGDRSAAINNPNISKTKGHVGRTPLDPQIYITETELITYWGNPDAVTHNDNGQKQLLYKRKDLRWNGIILMAIVPIPLLVPVGHDYLLFTIDHGNVTSVFMKNNSGELGLWFWIGPMFHPSNWFNARATLGVIEDSTLSHFSAEKKYLLK